ncbi:MAG: O-antigen ligase family protein [Planctomycetes bacterium]|nr:O-antigen ligase family protein [Planctomycetota bacterium]
MYRNWLSWLTIVIACLAPVASDCEYRWGWTVMVAAVLLLLIPFQGQRLLRAQGRTPLDFVFFALLGLHILQMLPLPPGLLAWLAPVKAAFVPAGADPGAWRPLSANLEATRDNLLTLFACYGAYVLGFALMSRPSRAERMGIAMLAVAGVLAVYGFTLLAHPVKEKFPGVPEYNPDRLSSTYTNPNRFAGYLEMILPMGAVAIGLLVVRGARGERRFSEAVKWGFVGPRAAGAVAFGAAWLVVFVALLLTRSRMGIAACLAGAVAATAVAMRGRVGVRGVLTAGAAFAMLIVVGLALGLSPVMQRYSLLFEESLSGDTRVQIWRDSLGLLRDHWLLGGGSGAFRSLYAYYQSPEVQGYAKFAHNDYLNAWCDLGLAGLGVIVAGFALWWRRVLKAFARRNLQHRVILWGCCWAVAALLLHSLVDFSLQGPANAWLFCLILGVGLGATESREGAPGEIDPPAEREAWRPLDRACTARAAALAVLCLLASWQALNVLSAEIQWPGDRASIWIGRMAHDLQSASIDADRARAKDPYCVPVRYTQAQGLVNAALREQDEEARVKMLDHAQVLCQEAQELAPLDPNPWYQLARVAMARNNDWAAAKTLLDKARRAAPGTTNIAYLFALISMHAQRAQGWSGVGVNDEALDALRRWIESNPQGAGQAAQLLFSFASWERRWAEILPPEPVAHHRFAGVLMRQGLREEACAMLEQGLGLFAARGAPRTYEQIELESQMRLDLSLVQLSVGKSAEGVAGMLSYFRNMHSNNRREKFFELWTRRLRQGTPDAGLAFAQALVAEFPDEPWTHEAVGRAATSNGDWQQAEASYRRAIALDPDPETYHQLANLFFTQKLYNSAMAELTRAIQMKPLSAVLRLSKAELLSRLGYQRIALEELDNAQRLDPSLSSRCRTLRQVYAKREVTGERL